MADPMFDDIPGEEHGADEHPNFDAIEAAPKAPTPGASAVPEPQAPSWSPPESPSLKKTEVPGIPGAKLPRASTPRTFTPGDEGTLSQGSPSRMQAANEDAVKAHDPYAVNGDIGFTAAPGLTPNMVRSGLNSATLNLAPRALAAMDAVSSDDEKAYQTGLHKWHDLYSKASEENQGSGLVGGLALPLGPLAKVGLAGSLAVGAGTGFVAGYMGENPDAKAGEKILGGVKGAAAGAAFVGVVHGGMKAVTARPTVVSAPIVQDLSKSLSAIPESIPESLETSVAEAREATAYAKGGRAMEASSTSPTKTMQQLAADPAHVETVTATKPSEVGSPLTIVYKDNSAVVYGMNDAGKITVLTHDLGSVAAAEKWRSLKDRHFSDTPENADLSWGDIPAPVQDVITAPWPSRIDVLDRAETLQKALSPRDERPPGATPEAGPATLSINPDGTPKLAAIQEGAKPPKITKQFSVETKAAMDDIAEWQKSLPANEQQSHWADTNAGSPGRATPKGVVPPAPPPHGPEPMPPPPPPGPPPPPEAKIQETIFKLAKEPGLWEQSKRQLIGAHLRAPLDFAAYVSDHQSIKNLEKGWVATSNALERKLGSVPKVREFRQDVLRLFTRDITTDQMGELHPEAWAQIRDMVGDAVKMRDANQEWLASRGYVPDETYSQAEGDLFKAYATREYAAHNLPPGEWAKIIVKDRTTMQTAVEGYKNWALKRGETLNDATAQAKILEAIGADDPAGVLFDKSKPPTGGSAAPTGKLKYREDLPSWYRQLLGENRDGFLAISRTLATQDALIANFKVWEGVAANPEWAQPQIPDGAAPGEWRQLDVNPRAYGKASGMYVKAGVYDSLVTLPNIKYEGGKILQALVGFTKTNQVSLGSLRTFMNMNMDNLAGGVLSGGIDITRPIATSRAIRFAAKAMTEFRANPLAENEFSQFIRDARRIGTDAPGHIGADQTSIQKRQALNMMTEIGGYKEEGYPNLLKKMWELHQRAGAKGSMVVDGIDRIHKLGSWKMITDDLVAKGMPREDAMRSAARDIFESYPMYDRVGPLADRMRNSIGIVSPYVTYAMERNRVWASVPGRLMGPKGAELQSRLIKYALLGQLLYGANNGLRGAGGTVSKEEVEHEMSKRRGSLQEQYSPEAAMWVAPVRIGGKPVVMDMTQWFAPLAYLQGDQSLSPAWNIVANVVRQPLSGGWAGEGVDAMQQAAGVNVGFQQRPPMPGTSAVKNVGDRFIRGGAVPNSLNDASDVAQKAGLYGPVPKGKEMMPPAQALGRLGGFPIAQQPTDAGKKQQEIGAIGHAYAIMKAAHRMPWDKAEPLWHQIVDWFSTSTDPEGVQIRKAATGEIRLHQKELSRANAAKRKAQEQTNEE